MRAPMRSSSTGQSYAPPRPSFLGTRVFADYALAELEPLIDWSPFFATWELTGKFPAILDDAKFGEAARALYDDARAMLREDRRRALVPRERRGRLLAGQRGRATTSRCSPTRRAASRPPSLHTLRQQLSRREGRANTALADFVAPKGIADYVGAFVVTAGLGEDAIAERFKGANDDYSSILVKALADRLAEAFAERMHQRVRREFWGYAADETLEQRRPDRGEISRHPPGAGLSGAARPHREGDACSACSTASARSA